MTGDTSRTLARIDRLQQQRAASVHAALPAAQALLTAPDVPADQRAANGSQYMRCVIAQLREIDAQIWAETCQHLGRDGQP